MTEKNEFHRYITRNYLEAFVRKAFQVLNAGSTYSENWHIDAICEYLMAVYRGDIKRLNINMPPRFMKSDCCTVCFPVWVLGLQPEKKIIACSYSAELSQKLHNKSRIITKENWFKNYFPQFNIDDSGNYTKDTQRIFQTTKAGFRSAASVGGTVTGDGADILILDDVINPQQASSDTQRKNAIDWCKTTLFSRINDEKTGAIIHVAQRLHENDFVGEVVDNRWESLILPAYFEEKKYYYIGDFEKTVEAGEYLFEKRFGEEEINNKISDMGTSSYNAQYNQNPAPADGNMFKEKWFKRYDHRTLDKNGGKITISLDSAGKDGLQNDPSVFTVWIEKENQHYLLEVIRKKLEYPELKKEAIKLCEIYEAKSLVIEDKSSGMALIQELRKEPRLRHVNIFAINPKVSKPVRAEGVTGMVESGKVLIPFSAEWIAEFLEEFKKFPNVLHDDQVDSTTMYLHWAKSRPVINPRIRSFR